MGGLYALLRAQASLPPNPSNAPAVRPSLEFNVFQPFQRLVDHGSGVGLGLAIARGFTEAMGGELAIEDTPGGGATMIVTLPQHSRQEP